MATVEKLTLKNMGIAFGILSLSGTEPEIHLGVITLPQLQGVFKNTTAIRGLIQDTAGLAPDSPGRLSSCAAVGVGLSANLCDSTMQCMKMTMQQTCRHHVVASEKCKYL